MPIVTQPNRILITDRATGAVRFDTDDKHLHILDRVSGARSFPARQVDINANRSRDSLVLTNTFQIGNVPGPSEFVFGVIKLDYGSAAPDGLSENAWFSITGGAQYMHVFSSLFRDSNGFNYGPDVQQIVSYDFTLQGSGSGRHVQLRERINLYLDANVNGTVAFGVKAFTMSWRLRVGAFT